MGLIEQLRAEHDLIEQVAGSLRTFVRERAQGRGSAADGPLFIGFFRLFAGDFHHAREEDTLFVALRDRVHLPEGGPIAVLLADHARMAGWLADLAQVIGRPEFDGPSADRLQRLAFQYSEALWHHIDAENSVLFPEADVRLRRVGLAGLAGRDISPAEAQARAVGEDLIVHYPESPEPAIIRGDGCVCCPAMANGCAGLEHSWWNEWDWEELQDHIAEG